MNHVNSTQSDFLSEFTSEGELEEVLTRGNIGNESQPLLHCSHHRSCTVSPTSWMLCGVYNKCNYFSSCYNICWLNNGKHGPRTQQLLCFGGAFSRGGSVFATLTMLIFALLPFAAGWPFFFENLKKKYLLGLLIFTTSIEFILFLWHFYCIYITKTKNYETWVSSWFTFVVKRETLRNMEDFVGSHLLFDLPGKLRVIDVSVPDLCRLNSALPQITVNEREKLATRIEKCRVDQAAVILYSEEFISEFVTHAMYGTFVLAALSVTSCAVLTWKTIITM